MIQKDYIQRTITKIRELVNMTLESNKTLGGVGSILLAIPFLNLVGIILVLIALNGLADYYKDEDIFKNALYGFLFVIIGIIALIATILIFAFGIAIIQPYPTPTSPSTIAGVSLIIVVIAIMYIFSIIGSIFYRRAFNKLAEKSNEKMFSTAGLLLLIGALIPLVGQVIIFVAWILAAVGFFSIKIPLQSPTIQATTSDSDVGNFCRYCGSPNSSDASFCQKCGKSLK